MQNQDDILNPDKVLAREKAEQELQDAARAEALDTVLYEKKMDEMFKYKERKRNYNFVLAHMRDHLHVSWGDMAVELSEHLLQVRTQWG